MGEDGYIFTSSLLRYLKDEWNSQHHNVGNNWIDWKIVGHTVDVSIQPNGKHHIQFFIPPTLII